jgi:hypothetical protein
LPLLRDFPNAARGLTSHVALPDELESDELCSVLPPNITGVEHLAIHRCEVVVETRAHSCDHLAGRSTSTGVGEDLKDWQLVLRLGKE